MTTGPAHPYLGPGSLCLGCSEAEALAYGHLCRRCDSTVPDEPQASRCVAPLRCYCAECSPRVERAERVPTRMPAELRDELAARRARRTADKLAAARERHPAGKAR